MNGNGLLEPWSVFTFILGGLERTGVITKTLNLQNATCVPNIDQDTSPWLGFRKLVV